MIELKKVLYVEDEADIREVGKIALEAVGGFEVHLCAGGPEALEAAPCFAPQLILLDVMMPGMDGPTTLMELRKIPGLAQTPVVFITAKVLQTEVRYYQELGALGTVSKPFDPMTLADQLKDLWSNR